jgi:hypothetical protein
MAFLPRTFRRTRGEGTSGPSMDLNIFLITSSMER